MSTQNSFACPKHSGYVFHYYSMPQLNVEMSGVFFCKALFETAANMSFDDYVTHLVNLSRFKTIRERSVFQHSGEKISKFFCILSGYLPVFCPINSKTFKTTFEKKILPKIPPKLWNLVQAFEEWKYSLETGLDADKLQVFLRDFENLKVQITKAGLDNELFSFELSFLFSIHSKFFHYFKYGVFTYQKILVLEKGDVLGTLSCPQESIDKRVSSIFVWEPVVLLVISDKRYERFCRAVAGNPLLYANAILEEKEEISKKRTQASKQNDFTKVWAQLKENLNESVIRNSYIHNASKRDGSKLKEGLMHKNLAGRTGALSIRTFARKPTINLVLTDKQEESEQKSIKISDQRDKETREPQNEVVEDKRYIQKFSEIRQRKGIGDRGVNPGKKRVFATEENAMGKSTEHQVNLMSTSRETNPIKVRIKKDESDFFDPNYQELSILGPKNSGQSRNEPKEHISFERRRQLDRFHSKNGSLASLLHGDPSGMPISESTCCKPNAIAIIHSNCSFSQTKPFENGSWVGDRPLTSRLGSLPKNIKIKPKEIPKASSKALNQPFWVSGKSSCCSMKSLGQAEKKHEQEPANRMGTERNGQISFRMINHSKRYLGREMFTRNGSIASIFSRRQMEPLG